ncbi:hypothetical protein EQG49_10425 [Periweissella cryptocerci]|uniref:GyrI-like small molecule binding domain-containing protein n=1 Tax=Periweissella cryptocerci TaxID=2506420 RepID=A0A4P6YVK6_9LACO|nr:GyrI-like domain-containing protein [Periweissella cryptocerci]QBO36828.1 hypothetical protein EQG49_10425 [Periweissella cryptocerci]
MADKYEWRKREADIYWLKATPTITQLPAQKFIMLQGSGNPNDNPVFAAQVAALYAVSYAIKMAPKKGIEFPGAYDYTVYPLEAVWSYASETQGKTKVTLTKDDFSYTLMMKQPDFVDEAVFAQGLALATKKISPELAEQMSFTKIDEGLVAQVLHTGTFDSEAATFAKLDLWLADNGYERTSFTHKEIYLSDPKRVAADKQKTILRVNVIRK